MHAAPSSNVAAGREWRAGLADIAPVVIAAAPFALLFGTLAAEKGLTPLEVALMSATVFAGSAQFVAVGIWTEPAAWTTLGLAALLVNIRHVLMGASLGGRLTRFGRVGKALALFFLADEVWALAERRVRAGPLTPAYYAGLGICLWAGWIILTTLGAAVGGVIADPARYGFDFAFTAIFIALLAGFWRGSRTGVVLAASTVAAIAGKAWLPDPWYVLAGTLAGMAAAVFLAQGRDA